MAEESKIKMTIKEETKELDSICERLVSAVKHEVDKGIEGVDTKELGEVIDMIKDLSEAKEKIIKGCYYKQIMEAMEESEYGEDYDEEGPMDYGRRGYRGQRRDSRGRYMSRRRGYDEMMPMDYKQMEQMRDMDREGMNRMYYSGNSGGSNSSGGSSSGGSSGGNMNSGNMSGGSTGGSSSSRNYGGESGGRDYREGRSGQQRRSYMEAKELHKGNTAEDKQKKMKELEAYMTELGSDITEMISGATTEEKNMLKTKMQTLAQKIV